ncbi:Rdx family-domain-containing protein [Aspergillus falconensis]
MTEPTAPIETHPPTQSQSAKTCSKPRITIQYCTQCKWMLRAAYFAQELLSTFNTDIGEIALVPRTGGVFTVTLFPSISTSASTTLDSQFNSESESRFSKEGTILWDRKRDGGFPEVKELKSRVRNVIDPGRDLGHTDRALKKGSTISASATATASTGTGSGAGSGAGKGAKVGKFGSGSGTGSGSSTEPGIGTGTEPGIKAATATPASLSARAKAVGETAGGAGQGSGMEEGADSGAASTSASDAAPLSARAKIVDETAGGTERKSDEEVCEDCI